MCQVSTFDSQTSSHLIVVCMSRGLAALHAYDPTLCHRDIKSFNFLVDRELNVKVADLELGITNAISKQQSSAENPAQYRFSVSSVANDNKKDNVDVVEDADDFDPGHFAKDMLGGARAADVEMLANWSAPEVIRGGHHSQASDVYSLSLVLWEIVSGSVPFSEFINQREVRYKVTQIFFNSQLS